MLLYGLGRVESSPDFFNMPVGFANDPFYSKKNRPQILNLQAIAFSLSG